MTETDEIIQGIAEAFDELRGVFFPGETLNLLDIDEATNDFNVLLTVDSGWYLEYAEYRSQFKLSVATADIDFAAQVNKSSHVRVGEQVYLIEKGDTLPPQGGQIDWKLFCSRGFSKSAFKTAY